MGLKQWDKITISYYTTSEQLKVALETHHDKLLELSNIIKYESIEDCETYDINEHQFQIKIGLQI